MSSWNQDNRAAQQLAMAKKSAAKNEQPRESWWAAPNLSREDFQQRLRERHRQILNSASSSTRSLHRVI